MALVVVSCASDVDRAVRSAGDNAGELKKVLEYFRGSGDEEKLKAAEYIIKYMPGHKSMHGDYWGYWEVADSLLDCQIPPEALYQQLDSLSAKFDISYLFDIWHITADYLINDIDNAVDQWREGIWARHLSFDEFCEWLLPYTCSGGQPLYDWRDSLENFAKGHIENLNECEDFRNDPRAAIERVNGFLKGMITKQKWVRNPHGPSIYRPDVFVKMSGARCDEYAEVATLVMRSKGIPVGIDFAPQWADRLYGHSWCAFPTLRGKTSQFNPFWANPDYPHYPHAIFAKVFRRTYKYNEEYVALMRRNEGRVPHINNNVFFEDVTDAYMRTEDIKVRLNFRGKVSGKDVYIAVFDDFKWEPVYWGRRKGNCAYFEDMGCGVTYIVLGYDKFGNLVPFSLPFILDFSGNPIYLALDANKTYSFKLNRKYPLFQHVYWIHSKVHGGRIEASDNPEFRNAEEVVKLPEWSLTSGVGRVTQSAPYRYWRFRPDSGRVTDMADLFFYIDDEEFPVKEFQLCNSGNSFSNLFDGDPLTNYSASDSAGLGYIDFGKAVKVDHVSYIRRGDGNAIVPGDVYEIYYWKDGKWVLHSRQKAKDVYLDINGIPAGTIYYIRGLSRGVQNWIFCWDESAGEIRWL